jgi:hypothetical protein
MNKVATILLFVAFWTGTTRSTAFDITTQTLHAEQKAISVGVIHGPRECCVIPLVEPTPNNPLGPGPAEEESEDEDNTSKENVVHKMTSLHLSIFLQQLYDRQNALFKEHHQEIEVPPPRR